jgi:hypothetical protein
MQSVFHVVKDLKVVFLASYMDDERHFWLVYIEGG